MAAIGLPKGSGKRLKVRESQGKWLKVREKSVKNFEMDIEWQPWVFGSLATAH